MHEGKLNTKFWNILYIISDLILIILILVTLLGSLSYWNSVVGLANTTSSKLYLIGNLIVIVTVLGQWISGRWRAIMRSARELKGGSKNGRRKRRKKDKESES